MISTGMASCRFASTHTRTYLVNYQQEETKKHDLHFIGQHFHFRPETSFFSFLISSYKYKNRQ